MVMYKEIIIVFFLLLFFSDIAKVSAQENPNDFQHPIQYIALADDVIAIDGRGDIYSFDALQTKDAEWQKVIFEDKFQNFKIRTATCSLDGSGY